MPEDVVSNLFCGHLRCNV